jgi:hypothetical protein
LILASLKHQERLENSNTLRKTEAMEIGIQRDAFREERDKLADRIIGLNQQLVELFTANRGSSVEPQ